MNQPLTRFSQEWWSAYQTTWNEQENLGKKFTKLGKVILWFSDRQGVSVCSEWDDQGQIVSLELIEEMTATEFLHFHSSFKPLTHSLESILAV